ncbi:hypothetical protein MA16_Dca007170 [Dendrobium catenatum]|uniref:Uncharacterized protein n=1 Tax=Dendrobium catenatum TaxID=906689 RepID=A0A2I0W456_9ASPA|nr:hypothetical protein MA16_Dca007170 [Dendrobium catenatum]
MGEGGGRMWELSWKISRPKAVSRSIVVSVNADVGVVDHSASPVLVSVQPFDGEGVALATDNSDLLVAPLGGIVLPGIDAGVISNHVLTPAGVNVSKAVANCSVVAVNNDSTASTHDVEISLLPAVNVKNNVESVRVENLNGNSVWSNNLVDVPVNLVDTHTLANRLRDNSRFDIRNHVGSSDFESESDFSDCGLASPDFCGGSDPGNEFTVVRDRPVCSVASRGRFRGRGQRRR